MSAIEQGARIIEHLIGEWEPPFVEREIFENSDLLYWLASFCTKRSATSGDAPALPVAADCQSEPGHQWHNAFPAQSDKCVVCVGFAPACAQYHVLAAAGSSPCRNLHLEGAAPDHRRLAETRSPPCSRTRMALWNRLSLPC